VPVEATPQHAMEIDLLGLDRPGLVHEISALLAAHRINVEELDTDRLPAAHVTFSRRNIFKRDHYTCQYCGAQPGSEELTLDHVLPRSQGGVSSWENCVLACMACNKRKADRTPDQARMRVRKAPVRPTWKPLYADHDARIESWSKFISEAYWNVTLRE